LSVNLR